MAVDFVPRIFCEVLVRDAVIYLPKKLAKQAHLYKCHICLFQPLYKWLRLPISLPASSLIL